MEASRLKSAFELVVEQTLPGVDFYAQYPGTIIAQNGQLFDFQPDNPVWPGIQGLKFYSGPGVTLTLDISMKPRAVLFFENYQPSSPALGLLGNPGLVTHSLNASQEIDILAPTVKVGNNATAAAGRVGDEVQVTIPTGTVIVSVTPGPPAVGVPNPAPITLTGTITAGSSEVTIG
jgi:hypothetical protein